MITIMKNCVLRSGKGLVLVVGGLLTLAACAEPGSGNGDDGEGGQVGTSTGGTTGAGGGTSTGGVAGTGGRGTGGTVGTGGAVATGGVIGTGGVTGTGGKGTGGATATGGVTGTGGKGTGGATATGGVTGTGGKGTGGATATGGVTGTGGKGTGGATATGGATGTGGSPSNANLCTWPTAAGSQNVSSTISVSGTYDGGMKRFIGTGDLGSGSQSESQGPIFDLKSGATLQNVILGNPAADGVHCEGTCTLKNVWWEDVGEDAATLKGSSSSQTMTIDGGGAQKADDKVFQHNGPGTMIIKNFCAQDFGKLYRSCGNCDTQYTRHLQMQNILAIPSSNSETLAGMNANYNDTATFSGITVKAKSGAIDICQRYTGNDTGAEPPKIGAGNDGKVCIYSTSDITWQN